MGTRCWLLLLAVVLGLGGMIRADEPAKDSSDSAKPVDLTWGMKVPMRDGVKLNATLYKPRGAKEALPVVFTMTPYISDSYHDRAMYFARNGYVYALVDVRGRGNSGGQFEPFANDARDGHDVVEWLARQPWCDGKVAMWGGSYAGFNQWAALKENPPHLSTIVPAAAAHPGVDFPATGGIFPSYDIQWLTFTSGVTPNAKLFGEAGYWASKFRQRYEEHTPFRKLDTLVGNPSPHFQKWIENRKPGAYLDAMAPTPEQYARIDVPVLTITGHYDGDQAGAMTYYRRHMQYGSEKGKARHYLLMGPWDHAGTRTPKAEVGGLKFGKASLLDLNRLHREWYDWTMKGGKKPAFLEKRVAYYVTGAEEWRFADSLEAIPVRPAKLYLTTPDGTGHDAFRSGVLSRTKPGKGSPAKYVYDPLDLREMPGPSELEEEDTKTQLTDQRLALELAGNGLVYHSAPMTEATDVAGYLKVVAWVALDVPDTDFAVNVFEIKRDGTSVALTEDRMRARYRESLRKEQLAKPGEVNRYEFQSFNWFARRLEKGSRLRLVFYSPNSRYWEKNYNSGGEVADESRKDARTAHVTLYQDADHPSYLEVPFVTPPRTSAAAKLDEELLTAAGKGDAAAVKALLGRGADVNSRNAYGATALSLAADKGHLEVVKSLLERGADPDVKDTFYKASPLDWAVSHAHPEIVKALLAAGAEGADNALQSAAALGKVDLVRAILDAAKPKQDVLTQALAVTPAKETAVRELLTKAGAKPPAPVTAVAVDKELLAAYAGSYFNDRAGELKVAVEDGKMTARFGTSTTVKLNAIDKASFKTEVGGVTFTFRREGDKVTGLTMKADTAETIYKRGGGPKEPKPGATAAEDKGGVVKSPLNWPSFRGPNASGVADGQFPPLTWDVPKGVNVRWKTPIPGLGHSCPVVWGDRVYLTTAVGGGKDELKPGLYGNVDSVKDSTEHKWQVLCLDRRTGKIVWERTACQGVPKVKRHPKGSHANPTPAADGAHVVVSFGSEGLYCYDREGKLLWQKNLGTLDSGWFYDADYQWGFGSSPIIYKGLVIVQCDVGKGSFIAAFRVDDGKEVWRKSREEIPSWGTPTVVEGPGRAELVTNATKFARGYDPLTGDELWRLGRHAEITVPTPVYGAGLIFITSGYRPVQPIYAIRPGARGDISLTEGKTTSDAVAWSTDKGGPYMPTPIVYGDYLYLVSNAGIVTCYEAKTGKQVYKERLGGSGGYTASPVAADGKVYFIGEESGVRVVRAGPKFEVLAVNPLGEPCLATPAISDGMIFVRTQHHLLGLARKE
jgi:putative CocE/NonD family hydrolase